MPSLRLYFNIVIHLWYICCICLQCMSNVHHCIAWNRKWHSSTKQQNFMCGKTYFLSLDLNSDNIIVTEKLLLFAGLLPSGNRIRSLGPCSSGKEAIYCHKKGFNCQQKILQFSGACSLFQLKMRCMKFPWESFSIRDLKSRSEKPAPTCAETIVWWFCFPLQEYTKSQIVGLINLVATMKGWKRKTRLEVLEKIE